MMEQQLVEILHVCAAQCKHCYEACRMEQNNEHLQRCMVLDQDCTEMCRITAQALERNSENGPLFMALCAEVCSKCAAECEQHSHMEHCRKCAEACRKCAEACRSGK